MRRPAVIVLVLSASLGAARADEAPSLIAAAKLLGRVYEKGTINPLPGAHVTTSRDPLELATDGEGRFALTVAAGPVDLAITADGHEPLLVHEVLRAGQQLTVEYRLLPKANARRYESTVVGDTRHEGQRFVLRDDELQKLPGALGDPFRVIGSLPGVGQPLPLLPVFVIRGAPPGTTGFFLDGMRIPQLYHSLIGGGIIHARLVEKLDFYPGAYDVTFGHQAGGIISGETHPARDGNHGEVELRVFDISALVELTLPKGVKLEFGGHYGWPGPILRAVDSRIDLNYWDYQLRLDWHGLTVEAIGSWDGFALDLPGFSSGVFNLIPNPFHLSFHRVQIRDRERIGPVEIEAALVGGYDEFSGNGPGVKKLSLGFRFNLRYRRAWFRLQTGVDGEVSRFTPENFAPGVPGNEPDEVGDLGVARTGIVAGAYVEGSAYALDGRLSIHGGVRADVYHAGVVTLVGVDPRAQVRFKFLPELSVIAGIGLYQQPPSFPLPLPGIDTFSLQLGLQSATQGAVTFEARLPGSLVATASGYYQRFANVNDLLIDFAAELCSSPPPPSLYGLPVDIIRTTNGSSYGMELLLRRQDPQKFERLTGWISYTLSRSSRVYSCGLRPADFDQTHLLNIVVQLRLPWHILVGAHLYYASGRPATLVTLPDYQDTRRNNTRLPDYVQLDLRLDKEWIFNRWVLSAFIEVINSTFSMSVYGLDYPTMNGTTRYDQPTLNGFRWILPSLGLRGRF